MYHPMKKLSKESLLIAAFVLIFLSVYQPFGLKVSQWAHLIYILGFACTTWVTLVFTSFVLHSWRPLKMTVERGTAWLLGFGFFQISFISWVNWLYHNYLQNIVATPISWFSFLVYTWGVGVFPLFWYFWRRKNLGYVSQRRSSPIRHKQAENHIENDLNSCVLQIGQASDQLKLPLGDILWIKAEGNYVQVHYQVDHIQQQKLVRSTIVQIEKDLVQSPIKLCRCHRSILINPQHFQKISRESGGYVVESNWCPEGLPVSRNYLKDLQSFIPK